jgi:hypothetical protein
MRLKFRADDSRHPEASACFRCIVPWSALKRDQEETGSVLVPPELWHRRAQVRRRSCGAKLFMPACWAHRIPDYVGRHAGLLSLSTFQNAPEYFSLAHA